MDKTQPMTLPGGNRTRRSRALRGVRGTAAAGALVSLAAVGLLLGGCSKEPLEGPGGGRAEIILQAELPNVVVLQGVSTRAVADPSQDMDMYFERRDESAPGVWGDAEVLPARRPAGQWLQPITFSPTQYYLSGDLKTRMAGWYPGGAKAPGGGEGYYDAAAGTVSWTIDGSQDILLAEAREGTASEPMDVFRFTHALTQLQFHCYAATEASAQKWGTVTRIEVRGQRTLCTYDLSAERMSFGGAEQTLTVPGEAPLPLPVGDKAQALLFGEPMMVHPRTEPEQLQIMLHTSDEGPVTAIIPKRAYLPGKSAKIVVRFEKEKVEVILLPLEIDDYHNAYQQFEQRLPYIIAPNIIVNQDIIQNSGFPVQRFDTIKWNSHSFYRQDKDFNRYNNVMINLEQSRWTSWGHTWNYIQVCKKIVKAPGGAELMRWQDITRFKSLDDPSLTGSTPCATYWENSPSEQGKWRVATANDMAKILINLYELDVDWWDGKDNCLIALNNLACDFDYETMMAVHVDITKARKEVDEKWGLGPYGFQYMSDITPPVISPLAQNHAFRCVCVRDLNGI